MFEMIYNMDKKDIFIGQNKCQHVILYTASKNYNLLHYYSRELLTVIKVIIEYETKLPLFVIF